MKRISNIWQDIISPDNLELAAEKASKGKKKQYGYIVFNKDREANLVKLHESLINKTFRTSEYKTMKVYEPKERLVYRLPFFPDRIVHHAIMNHLETMFVKVFTADTYSCIKERGIHAASFALRRALKDQEQTTHCLKFDIRKFYPSVDHETLKQLLRRKIKDKDLLWLLDEIIDSAPGVPIGNYLSQYFANFYLTYFDHHVKENMKVKHYFRYADDCVILGNDKDQLHKALSEMREYLGSRLKLDIKHNYQVFPVQARGIDFVGYVHFHRYTLLRKSIKKRFAVMLSKNRNPDSINSYFGWAKHCNSKNLLKKLLHDTDKTV